MRSRVRLSDALFRAANDTSRRSIDPATKQLASVLINSGLGVVRGDLDGGPRWVNEAFSTLSGYTNGDLGAAPLSWSAMTPSRWHARDAEMVALARRTGFTAPYEKEFLRRDGSRWPVLVAYAVDPVDSGQITMFVVDLPGSLLPRPGDEDPRHARFFEDANVDFWTTDDCSVTADNGRIDLIHPDDRVFAVATWAKAVATRRSYDIEIRSRDVDGLPYRWVRVQAFPDIVAGDLAGWYGTTEDIDERRLATNALTASDALFNQLADDIPVMLWMTDAANVVTYMSRSWFDLTGQVPEPGAAPGWGAVLHPDDRARLAADPLPIDGQRSFDVDFRVRCADGSYRWMLNSGRPRIDAAGGFVGYAGALTDIHARKEAERQLADTQRRLSHALDGTGVGVWDWDAATGEVRINGSAMRLSDKPGSSFDYQVIDYSAAVHPEDLGRLLEVTRQYIEGRSNEFEVEIRVRSQAGNWVWVLDRGTATARDETGRALRMVGTLTNIDDRKRGEERLRWAINHDALTGLANRTLFKDQLCHAIAAAGEDGCVALALLDIDNFKAVNDVLGHGAGDALLLVLAERLRDFVRPGETAARLGGDEFTLVLPSVDGIDVLMDRLELLRQRLAEPFSYDGETLSCRASIGVALAPGHGTDASTLLRNADAAMYAAKAALDTVTLFDKPLAASMHRRATRTDRIRCALNDGAVDTVYQPLFRLSDRGVVGFKAVVRVAAVASDDRRPETDDAGVVGAGNAELALALGERLLDRAFADYRSWQLGENDCCLLAFSAGAAELRRGDYAGRILGRAARGGVRTSLLSVSVASSVFGRGAGAIELTLARLRDAGVNIVLDGFGTGQGELALLQRLPLTALRIPGSLVAKLEHGRSDAAVVRAVVDLAHAFDLTVIAENVSTVRQAEMLAAMGCYAANGSLYGTTVAAGDVRAMLSS